MKVDMDWYAGQVRTFRERHPAYVAYAKTLLDVLQRCVGDLFPLATLQARPKSVPSFAEKILRRAGRYTDPAAEMNDLCGARIIVHTEADVARVCDIIRSRFVVNAELTQDVAERLRVAEFGYRSYHFTVRLGDRTIATPRGPVAVPDAVWELANPWAEIQVRTFLQHAWADIGHDMLYKAGVDVPKRWQREAARIAATLEEASAAFSRLVAGVGAFRPEIGTTLSEAEVASEIGTLTTVRDTLDAEAFAKDRAKLAHRIAQLALAARDAETAVAWLEPLEPSASARVLSDLGVALLARDRTSPDGTAHARERLERATALDPSDTETLCALADAWALDAERGVPGAEAQCFETWTRAYRLCASEPRVLAGYLAHQLPRRPDSAVAALVGPALAEAIVTSRDRAEARVDLPQSAYDLGLLLIVQERTWEGLDALCDAIRESQPAHLEAALRRFERMAPCGAPWEWARRMLLVARAARCGVDAELANLSTGLLHGPVVIVAGGCSAESAWDVDAGAGLVRQAFKGLTATVISGGTAAGVSGLVASLDEPGVRTVGYLPAVFPPGISPDMRYHELRFTQGTRDFSPMEPLQNWIDVFASGLGPDDVRVLGINGGPISGFEYRFALCLGARVGLLQDSGRMATRVGGDAAPGLAVLRRDADVVAMFLRFGTSTWCAGPMREALARLAHDAYRREHTERMSRADPTMVDWEKLPETFKRSTRSQADHYGLVLASIGARVVEGASDVAFEFTPVQVETMAKLEHERWMVDRLLDGWKPHRVRDPARKLSPYLVAWDALEDAVKDWDRNVVRDLPGHLARLGYHVDLDP